MFADAPDEKTVGLPSFADSDNGLVFNNISEMDLKLKNLDDVRRIKENVLNKRYEFTVEKNINRLIQFYEKMRSL